MSRIPGRFRELAEQGRTALIPYIVAGDPDLDTTVELMHRLVCLTDDPVACPKYMGEKRTLWTRNGHLNAPGTCAVHAGLDDDERMVTE